MPDRPAKLLCFDYGLRSIGAAFGQVVTGTANELKPLRALDGIPDWHAVENYLKEWQPDAIVTGLPLNMDGSESDLSAQARKFARRLEGRFNIPVILHDERLTTREAKTENRARGGDNDYKNHPVDSIAARLILESWLRSNPA